MINAYREYWELLRRWNQRIRLVGECEEEAVFQAQHLEDCLAMVPLVESCESLLDLGTGAGLPGIVLKIAIPTLRVALLDSVRKKIAFCEEAIRRLQLTDISATCARAEDQNVVGALGTFDVVISRATWELQDFIRMAIPYLTPIPQARIVAMKGARWREELKAAAPALAELGLHVVEAREYLLGGGEQRCGIVLSRIPV